MKTKAIHLVAAFVIIITMVILMPTKERMDDLDNRVNFERGF